MAVLRGLHVAVHMPTEERLTVQIEGLDPEKFRGLAADLEDWFAVVDDAYKETFVRGRGWKGRGRRVTQFKRVRILKFSPFPSRFSNILRTVRRDIYRELHSKCLVLAGEEVGGRRQNIYILPYANAPAFMKTVEEKNREIDCLTDRIKEFQKTSYFQELKGILKKYNVNINLDVEWKLGRITVDVTPLALEPRTVKEMVEEEYKRFFKKLEREEKEALEALHKELERKRRELVIKGVENLQEKLNQIINRITTMKKLKPKVVKKELDNLHKLAVSVGLESLAETVIAPLAEVVENPDKAVEVFGTKDLSEGVNGRIKALLESL